MNKKNDKQLSVDSKKQNTPDPLKGNLFDSVALILEEARANTVRAINSQMIIAYWLIGMEIVQELQLGKTRAGYGKQVIEQLSCQLTKKYGAGFSASNLEFFRKFYQVYSDRVAIPYPRGTESESLVAKSTIQKGFSPQLTSLGVISGK
jgi:hypothetical protein